MVAGEFRISSRLRHLLAILTLCVLSESEGASSRSSPSSLCISNNKTPSAKRWATVVVDPSLPPRMNVSYLAEPGSSSLRDAKAPHMAQGRLTNEFRGSFVGAGCWWNRVRMLSVGRCHFFFFDTGMYPRFHDL